MERIEVSIRVMILIIISIFILGQTTVALKITKQSGEKDHSVAENHNIPLSKASLESMHDGNQHMSKRSPVDVKGTDEVVYKEDDVQLVEETGTLEGGTTETNRQRREEWDSNVKDAVSRDQRQTKSKGQKKTQLKKDTKGYKKKHNRKVFSDDEDNEKEERRGKLKYREGFEGRKEEDKTTKAPKSEESENKESENKESGKDKTTKPPSDGSKKKKVEADVTVPIAYFGNLESSGTPARPDPLVETFVGFAVKHLNERSDQFPDLLPREATLNLTSVNTEGSTKVAMKHFIEHILATNKDLDKRWKVIIGFGEEQVTSAMVPFANAYGIPVIGPRNYRFPHNDDDDKEMYTAMGWDENKLYDIISKMFIARNWNRTVLIFTHLDYHIDEILRRNNISIVSYIQIPEVSGDKWNNPKIFYREMDMIAKSGTRIVFSLLTQPMNVFIFSVAYEKKVSGYDGYQWVSPHEPGLDFPIQNGYYLCNQPEKPKCTEMMQGFMIIGGINDLDYTSLLWQRVHLAFFFNPDAFKSKVVPRAYDFQLASTYARGYDAVVLIANALKNIVIQEEISLKDFLKDTKSRKLSEYLSTEEGVMGLTGLMKFNKTTGRREGFKGFVMTVYPGNMSLDTEEDLKKHRDDLRPEIVLQMVRYVKISDKNELIEIRCEANDYTKDYLGIGFDKRPYAHTLAIVALPRNATSYPRRYKSYVGIIDDDLQVVEDGGEEETFYKEAVVMAFDCDTGCGGNTSDRIHFANGDCVAQDKCICKKIRDVWNSTEKKSKKKEELEFFLDRVAYVGEHCEINSCYRCEKNQGNCTRPEHCDCLVGHSGQYCDIPDCGEQGCGAGVCREPMKCHCPGGFVGEHCQIVIPILLGPILFAGALLLCCLQNIFSNYRQRQKMQEMLLATDWLVKWEDILAVTKVSDTDVSMKFKETMSLTPSLLEKEMAQENIAEWKGHIVYLEIFKCDSLDLSKSDIRMEFIILKQLNHPNLSVFIGACVKSPNVCLLTDYYNKGSLQDVLSARNIPLDWDVKFSFLSDIAKGMEYIHVSAIESHGRLKSTNCLIDNRWGVRISGFGVRCMRDDGKVDHMYKETAEMMLWTAPELLRKHGDIDSVKAGTKAGDVYSFSIILGEVITEERPFNILRSVVSPEEIIMLLKRPLDAANRGLRATWIEMGGHKEEYPRPIINEDRFPEDPLAKKGLNSMMTECWNEDPAERPTFRDITTNFLVMRPVKGDLVDLLIRRLEKHSTKLEEQFVEAAKELQVEKKKVEDILSRMLPRKIVEDLIHGRKVDAEEFENVTIGFTDIADFVSMTKNASAFQVIELLNDLYMIFDNIIESFDVYKVETVRDEYMVSSGLPVRNGFLHASEVATCALHLMSAMTTFEIKYMPGRLLMLRVGIHTGPCVAGVVGYHMPRYCLFGDTINTASRMKSSSSALRIHISEDCFNVLKILGGFKTVYRGQREVKGRGKMHTYWLTGKSDFTKPLPDISLAVDESQQYFK